MSTRIPRFRRQVTRETGVTNPAAGAAGAELANELERFSARRQDDLDRQVAESGFLAGQQAGIEPGAPPEASEATIRGRAFNRGVEVSHQAALQTDIQESIGRFRVDHPADPEAFDARVEGLTEGLLAESNPRFEPFIRQRVADYAGRAKVQILGNQRAELVAQAQADLERGVEGFLDDARTAAFEGDVPLVEARRQELDELLVEAQSSELMDENQAGELRQQFEREVIAQEVVGNVDRVLREQGIDAGTAAIERWQAIKPSSVGLTPDQHEGVTRQLVTLRNRQRSLTADERARQEAALRAERRARAGRVNDAIEVLRSGFSPDHEQAQQVAADLTWLEDPELAADFDVAAAIQGEVHRFRRMPRAAREAELTELEQTLRTGGASADQVALLDALRSTSTRVDQALDADPRGYVNREGLVEDSALDFSSAEGLAVSIQARAEQTDIGRELIGEPLPLLTAAESEQIATVYDQATIEERVGLLGVLTAGAGEDAQATLAGLDREGHRQMALAGNLVRSGQANLAREILRGQAILTNEPAIKPKPADAQLVVEETIGAALSHPENVAQRAVYLQAAEAKYAELKARAGDVTEVFDDALYEQALNQVLPTAEFNNRRVAVPAGVTEDRFEDWTDHWQPADFAGVPGIDGEELLGLVRDRGQLVELGNGRYGITLTSALTEHQRALVREDGEPLILQFGEGEE